MNRLRLLGFATMIFITVLVQPTRASAQCTRCCFNYVLAGVSVSPTTAEEGQPVKITTSLYNCTFSAKVVTGTTTLSAPTCRSFSEAYSFSVYLPRGYFRSLTYTFTAPKCDGTYKIVQAVKTGAGTATQYSTAYLKVN